ncbi:retinoic acid receptor responder protein 2-like [Leptodactylus fuscus]|uniref:retinoic acid receptor responder protein 2-like n=1 Tax=Leptodactylus fuscus TaxID=238119 RepID=UPI003F4E58D3
MGSWWWISALLVMAMGADVDVGKEAIRLVREDFHKNSNIREAFQLFSEKKTVYQEQSDGTFVKVKFTMKQMNCKNHNWMKPECTPIPRAKRTYNCLGCFTFAPSGDLLKTGYKKCVRQSQAKMKQVKKERRRACAKLKGKKPTYNVGMYDFQRGPRGQY